MSSLFSIEKIINQNNYRLAINMLEKKVLSERNALYYYLLGKCYLNIKNFQKSYEYLKISVTLMPYGIYKDELFSVLLNEVATSGNIETYRKKIILDMNDRKSVHAIALYPLADIYFLDNMNLCPNPDYFLIPNWLSPYHPVYENIESLKCPVISLIVDRLIHAEEHIKANLIYSDIVVSMENYSVDLYKKQGFTNVIYYPCAGSVGYDPLAYPNLNLEKKYDVVFLGNISDSLMYKKRRIMLDKLEKLKSKYKIVIKSVSDYNEYWALTNQAKIVIDHTIDSKALNYRMFQASGIGTLCFVEENDMVLELYKDKEEIILYNIDNLESLLEYYLNNEQERQKVAKNGQIKTINNYTHYNMIKGVLEKIETAMSDEFIFPTQKRTFSSERFLIYKGVTKHYQNKHYEALEIFNSLKDNNFSNIEVINNIMVQFIKISESESNKYDTNIEEIYLNNKDYMIISVNYFLYHKYVKNNIKPIINAEELKKSKGLIYLPKQDKKFVEYFKIKHGEIIFKYGIDSKDYDEEYYILLLSLLKRNFT